MVNNATLMVIEGAKSISSRTMIRKKIIDYYQNKVTFQELMEYTQPKYIDGIKPLTQCIYAARYIKSGLLIEYKTEDYDDVMHQSDILDTAKHEIVAHIYVQDSILGINVISPIYERGKILGYDILYTQNKEILPKIEERNYFFHLQRIKSNQNTQQHNNQTIINEDSISLVVASNASGVLNKFSIPKKSLFKDIYSYQLRQLVFIVLLVIIITLFFFIIHQRARIYYFKKGKYLEALVASKTQELNNMLEEFKTKNEALHKSENQLLESNKTKDKFFSIIAHDLIGPLGSLVNVFDFLTQKGVDNETKEKYLNLAKETTEGTYKLLENLLTWSRSQRNMLEFNPSIINIFHIVSDTIKYLEQQAANKNLNLINEIEENLTAFADKQMVHTIVRNLISNAIKFTPKGGKIRISGRNVNNNQIQISVEDNGVGIEQEKTKTLFTLDHNSSERGTENEKGTGLGLMLCKDFVDKHQGEIWVESEVGKGSVFRFTIPAKK